MPTQIMESSPKFITCPDCGERYDNARKRRLIDTCGHPRCYSCLFVDNPCPLCEKLPKERPRRASVNSKSSSNENLEKVGHQRATNLKKDSIGSHPNLNELHKARSSTLPTSFRQDSYFRSLYRYEPHGSSENLSTRSASPPNSNGRPRSMPPSYHVSIENLNEQFWKSVELAERKIGPKKKATETQPKDPKEKVKTSTIEEVECPAPDVVRLPVPSLTHPKPQLDHHLRINGDKRNGFRPQKDQRPRSLSDINYKSQTHKIVFGDSTDGRSRPLSWSPIQFPTVTYGPGSRPSSVASGDSMGSPTGKLSPYIQRSTPKSDGFSDSSASIYLSDTWSESSDSDSVQSHTEEKNIAISAEQRLNDDSNPSQTPRKYTGNPLANVTYWVVEARNSVEVHKGYRETELDRVSPSRHRPAKVTHTQNWNGQTSRSPNAPMVSVHTDVSTL